MSYKVYGYTRVSTAKQTHGVSLQEQNVDITRDAAVVDALTTPTTAPLSQGGGVKPPTSSGRRMQMRVKLLRLSAASGGVGGILTALFWLATLPLGTFVGAEVVGNPLWIPSQTLHVLGALFAVLAFMGMYAVMADVSGNVGVLAFFLVVSGTILFLADGVIALAVFPALAGAAPDLLAASGAMNQGMMLGSFITFAAINMLGNLLFAFVLARSSVFPRSACVLLGVGGIMCNLPPGPVPLFILAMGGLLWSAAFCWCASALARDARRVRPAA